MNRITADVNTFKQEKQHWQDSMLRLFSGFFPGCRIQQGVFFSGSILYKVSDKTMVTLEHRVPRTGKNIECLCKTVGKINLSFYERS
jgi:iron complex outermembrane receptor protein